MCFSISRSNSLVDALSAASSTPGVPGPSTATVPARGEPRLVGGSSAAGAGPESVPVKSLRGWSSPDLSAPVLLTVSAPHPAPCQVPLGVYSPALEGGVGPSRLLPTLRPAAPCPLLNLRPHPGSILGPSPAALQAFPSSERPLSPALGAFTRPRPVTPRGLESHPTRPCLQGVFTFPGPPWKACSCCAGAAAFNSCDCRGAAGG